MIEETQDAMAEQVRKLTATNADLLAALEAARSVIDLRSEDCEACVAVKQLIAHAVDKAR